MTKIIFIFIALLSVAHLSFSQESEGVFSRYKDSSSYKIVIKTRNFNGTEDVALDNLTIKYKNGETKVYYIRYGDMLISSVTIPYSIIERFIEFEQQVKNLECKIESCTDSILIDSGSHKIIIPIDVLNEELVGSLMIELRQED